MGWESTILNVDDRRRQPDHGRKAIYAQPAPEQKKPAASTSMLPAFGFIF
jgi:hypothetical protein